MPPRQPASPGERVKPGPDHYPRRGKLPRFILALALAFPLSALADAPLKTLLMLDFEIIDHTGDTTAVPAQAARLDMISRQLRQEFMDQHLYTVVDRSAIQPLIDQQQSRFNLYDCNGCELELAKAAHADRVLTAWVQKVSNLILNINIEIKDSNTGATVMTKSVSIRGNTDQSWRRGISYMVRSMVEKQQGNR